eukprot:3417027-Rhodomonas_salina.1
MQRSRMTSETETERRGGEADLQRRGRCCGLESPDKDAYFSGVSWRAPIMMQLCSCLVMVSPDSDAHFCLLYTSPSPRDRG